MGRKILICPELFDEFEHSVLAPAGVEADLWSFAEVDEKDVCNTVAEAFNEADAHFLAEAFRQAGADVEWHEPWPVTGKLKVKAYIEISRYQHREALEGERPNYWQIDEVGGDTYPRVFSGCFDNKETVQKILDGVRKYKRKRGKK